MDGVKFHPTPLVLCQTATIGVLLVIIAALLRCSPVGQRNWILHSPGAEISTSGQNHVAEIEAPAQDARPLLVSYSFQERNRVQRDSFEMFLHQGAGLLGVVPRPKNVDFIFVISGAKCGPCEALYPLMSERVK